MKKRTGWLAVFCVGLVMAAGIVQGASAGGFRSHTPTPSVHAAWEGVTEALPIRRQFADSFIFSLVCRF